MKAVIRVRLIPDNKCVDGGFCSIPLVQLNSLTSLNCRNHWPRLVSTNIGGNSNLWGKVWQKLIYAWAFPDLGARARGLPPKSTPMVETFIFTFGSTCQCLQISALFNLFIVNIIRSRPVL